MPLPFFFGGALFTGVASGLWSYNRENYMWDWQVRQARDFQVHNMVVGRYALYREDIRDLAALTTSKMDSYLVVNTLKLGFIVQVFFNYDRTDVPVEEGTVSERQIVLLYSVCFITEANQPLPSSVFSSRFSMHASVVAQSFMTKMLLQAVRIPFPSDREIHSTAPEARDYERELGTAFRIPLLRSRSSPLAGVTGVPSSPSRPQVARSSTNVSGSSEGSRRSRLAQPAVPEVYGDIAKRVEVELRQLTQQEHSARGISERDEEGWSLPSQPRLSTAHSQSPIKAPLDATESSTGGSDGGFPEAQGLAPHLKFYGLVMANWQPFDLYSKICMSIGTSAMLSGIAYFTIYYTRRTPLDGQNINAHTQGWYTFLFLSVLAWWSVMLDLILSPAEHVIAGLVAMSAPSCIVLLSLTDERTKWVMPLAVLMQGLWVWLLCSSAIRLQDGWPRRWRASLFLDVLGSFGASRSFHGGTSRHSRARAAAASDVLLCLREALNFPMPEQLVEEVRGTCTRLEDLLSSAGHGPDPGGGWGATPKRSGGQWGFWLVLPTQDGSATQTHWVQPPCVPRGATASLGTSHAATLEELMGAAHAALTALEMEHASPAWTQEDAQQLAQYGGQIDGNTVEGFESQFRSKGAAAKSSMGKSAHRFFRATVAFVCLSWATAAIACLCIHHKHRQPEAAAAFTGLAASLSQALLGQPAGRSTGTQWLRLVSQEPLQLPRPWFAPTSMACSFGRLALSDGVRAFVMGSGNRSWLGPFSACDGADVEAVALAPAIPEAADLDLGLVTANHGGSSAHVRRRGSSEHCEADHRRASTSSTHRLTALAVDDRPSGSALQGLAVRDGLLVALESSAAGAWEVSGVLPSPGRGARRWVGVALRAGVGLALDARGAIFEFDSESGSWAGPWLLKDLGPVWRGICFAPGGEWVALVDQPRDPAGLVQPPRVELWTMARASRQEDELTVEA